MQSLLRRPATYHRTSVVLIVSLIIAGCARQVGQESQATSPSVAAAPTASPSPQLPTAEPTTVPDAEVILRVDNPGGLRAPDDAYAQFPPFTLLGDGGVVLVKTDVNLNSGRVVPDVQARRLTGAGVQAVLDAVAASGQLVVDAEWTGAQQYIADGGTTVFTLNANGRAVSVSVYGLEAFPSGELPPAELAAHQALNELLERLTDLDSWLPAAVWAQPTWEPYRPGTIRLFTRNADADPSENNATSERLWPNDESAAWIDYSNSSWPGEFRCAIAMGADAEAWYRALSNADWETRFVQDAHRFQVSGRPLLPDELAECPD